MACVSHSSRTPDGDVGDHDNKRWVARFRQVSSPVRWEQVVRRLIADGATTFVELGPGSVLAGLIKKIDRGVQVMSIEDEQGLSAAVALVKPGG